MSTKSSLLPSVRFFHKLHHLGNDFILLDQREEPIMSDLASLCHRHLGIGADGVLFLENSLVADAKMRIFNADGKEADMCGNGLLCVLRYLGRKKKGEYRIETKRGVFLGWAKESCSFSMPLPKLLSSLKIEGFFGYLVDSGVEHFVIEASPLDIEAIGRKIRFSPLLGERGANIDFVSFGDKIHLRVYERGVEKETLACGTGAIATAFVASYLGKKGPYCIEFASGEVLVCLEDEALLEGKPYYLFKGELSS